MITSSELKELEDKAAIELSDTIKNIVIKFSGDDHKCEIGLGEDLQLVISVIPIDGK